jgi:hypothetical protein
MRAPTEKSLPDMPMAFSMPKTFALHVSYVACAYKRRGILVERSLVEVLEGLSDQEQGQEEHVDTAADTLVLFFRLPC